MRTCLGEEKATAAMAEEAQEVAMPTNLLQCFVFDW